VAPEALGAGFSGATPVVMQGPLVFLGVAFYHSGKTLDAETWWRVSEGPIDRPFSVLGHLLLSDGQVVGQSDGLGISPLALHAGDVLVQRHTFAAPSDGVYWLRTGVYWGDTMERWIVADSPQFDLLLVKLQG
jgi:hypothetical protein